MRLKPLYGLLMGLALASCMTREERIAAQEAKDDRQCMSYGAQKGSDAYVNCRTGLSAARTNADAIATNSGPVVCNRVGNSTICN